MTGVGVRRARGDDVPGVRAVAERSWRRAYRDVLPEEEVDALLDEWYSREALRASVAGEASTLYVAERDGECVGFGEWGDRGLGPEVFRLYVDPSLWGRGIGTRLLGALESEMRREGVGACRLYVHRDNEVGRSFWEARGFERHPEGDREESPCEMCMRKELTDPSG